MSFNLINKGMWEEISPLQTGQMGKPKVDLNHVLFLGVLFSEAPLFWCHFIFHVKLLYVTKGAEVQVQSNLVWSKARHHHSYWGQIPMRCMDFIDPCGVPGMSFDFSDIWPFLKHRYWVTSSTWTTLWSRNLENWSLDFHKNLYFRHFRNILAQISACARDISQSNVFIWWPPL